MAEKILTHLVGPGRPAAAGQVAPASPLADGLRISPTAGHAGLTGLLVAMRRWAVAMRWLNAWTGHMKVQRYQTR
jgi:hypothetical protein